MEDIIQHYKNSIINLENEIEFLELQNRTLDLKNIIGKANHFSNLKKIEFLHLKIKKTEELITEIILLEKNDF